MRIAPPAFVAEMQRRFGAMWNVVWDDLTSRWTVTGPTADGRIVSQVWGWFVKWDAEKKQLVPIPVGEDGLPPFRDILDREDQLEILTNMERSYPFNRHDGDATIKDKFARILRENNAKRRHNRLVRATALVDMLHEVDGHVPKHHIRAEGAVLTASAVGVSRTPLFDHHNGKTT